MKYRTVTFESHRGEISYIEVEGENGSFESFPADENNTRYIQFLEETA